MQNVVATAMLVKRFDFQMAAGAPPVCLQPAFGFIIAKNYNLIFSAIYYRSR
jgi:hypothetical protein